MADSLRLLNWAVAVAFATGALLGLGVSQMGWTLWPRHGSHTMMEEDDSEEIVDGIEGCIGNTPLIRIKSLSALTGCDILAKAEFLNGAGNSPKDRVALNIINMAEAQGLLRPHSGDVIYEGTVGSTGISLAMLCRARGYRAHICMPDDQSTEKSDLLTTLGATVTRVRPASIADPQHYVQVARTLAAAHTDKSNSNSNESSNECGEDSCSGRGRGFFADQFETAANWRAHAAAAGTGTGAEILRQTRGRLDAFVAGAGTGGTLAGVARCIKNAAHAAHGVKANTHGGAGGGAAGSAAGGAAGGGGGGVPRVVLADPPGSGLHNKVRFGVLFDAREAEGARRRHQVDSVVEGIGLNRTTANWAAAAPLVDGAVRVTDAQALRMARWLVEKDGIFVGSSSCVNCVAAVKVAQDLGPGHRVVTVLCDSGTRHLSKFWRIVRHGTSPSSNASTAAAAAATAAPAPDAGAPAVSLHIDGHYDPHQPLNTLEDLLQD